MAYPYGKSYPQVMASPQFLAVECCGIPSDMLKNTLVIRNLPPTATLRQLLEHIAVAGPFGKLFAAWLTDIRDNMPDMTRRSAVLVMFDHDSAAHLRAFINWFSVGLQGNVLHAFWYNPARVPRLYISGLYTEDDVKEEDDSKDVTEDDRYASRTVLVTGPKRLLDQDFLHNQLVVHGLEDYQLLLEIDGTVDEPKFAVIFMSYPMARRARRKIPLLRDSRLPITVVYGHDPLERGVTTQRHALDPDKISIKFLDWDIERIPESEGSTKQDSDSGDPSPSESSPESRYGSGDSEYKGSEHEESNTEAAADDSVKVESDTDFE